MIDWMASELMAKQDMAVVMVRWVQRLVGARQSAAAAVLTPAMSAACLSASTAGCSASAVLLQVVGGASAVPQPHHAASKLQITR